MNDCFQQVAYRVDNEVTLLSLDLLIPIAASVTRQLGRFEPVTVDYRSGRLLIAAALLILRFGQGCLGLSSGSVFGPLAIVAVVIYRNQQGDSPA